MVETSIPDLEEVLAITDPGEIDRETHGRIDRMMIQVGNFVAWLFPILMGAIVLQVFLRGFGYNQAWLDDAQWWMYGVAMLTAFGYAITTSSHVRVDIFHQFYSQERKARIEAFALGWLMLPFIALMADVLVHYGWRSILTGEGSSSPNGLHRLYLLKATLPVLFLLSGAAAWSRFRHNLGIFGEISAYRQFLWMLPAAIFVGWRLLHYTFYWGIYLTNSEITPRRITREPIFDYTLWIVAGVAVFVLVLGFINHRRKEN